MRDRPEPPSSTGEPITIEYVLYELGRQVREGYGSTPPDFLQLRQALREQVTKSSPASRAYIDGLLASLNDEDITPELLWHALDLSEYAPAAENGAFRPEDYVEDEST